jgi:hypothetical protein
MSGNVRCTTTERALTAVHLLGGRQTMAVSKATRSKSSAQPQHGNSKTTRRRLDSQLKAEIFDTLRQLNHGYGSAVAALHRLYNNDRLPGPRIFSAGCLRNLQNRTEALRTLANRDLLRHFGQREEREAKRFERLGRPLTA